jgi:hypothetical protein
LKGIVDFEIVRLSKPWSPGNYESCPNGIEVEGIQRLIVRCKNDPIVLGCIHNNYSKATKAICDAGWNIEQSFDPNPISKSFDGKWAKVPHMHLRGLAAKIR